MKNISKHLTPIGKTSKNSESIEGVYAEWQAYPNLRLVPCSISPAEVKKKRKKKNV
jgi:hypothetical protein